MTYIKLCKNYFYIWKSMIFLLVEKLKICALPNQSNSENVDELWKAYVAVMKISALLGCNSTNSSSADTNLERIRFFRKC